MHLFEFSILSFVDQVLALRLSTALQLLPPPTIMPTKYQLSLHANKLKKRFLWQTPRPYAVVSLEKNDSSQPQQQQQQEILGKTESLGPSISPDWCQSIAMELDLGETTTHMVPFIVAIHDGKDDALLAQAKFEASQVFNSPGHMQMKEDSNGTQ